MSFLGKNEVYMPNLVVMSSGLGVYLGHMIIHKLVHSSIDSGQRQRVLFKSTYLPQVL